MKLTRRILALLPSLAFGGILALPALQSVSGFAPTVGLSGVVDAPPAPVPRTLDAWHKGLLQSEWEHALVEAVGLRDWMIRLDNQLKVALFGVTKSPVIHGSDDWLYDTGYLTARTHTAPHDCQAILAAAHVVWLAQQVLKEHGITMVLLVTPSKVETLPQHLPFPHRQVQAAGFYRDIDVMQAILALGCINHIDAQRLFWEWSVAEPDLPLFPRSGIHWSVLAAARVVVQLLDLLEKLSGTDMVNVDVASVQMGTGHERGQDDLLVLANLLPTGGRCDPLPMPVVAPRPGDQGRPAGLLVVGSSFSWAIPEQIERLQVARPTSVYYYFKTRHDWIDGVPKAIGPVETDPAALRAELLRYSCIVLECNATQVRQLGYDFPRAVLQAFGMPKSGTVPPVSPEQLGVVASMVGRRPTR